MTDIKSAAIAEEMPADRYHAGEGLSASLLKAGRVSMLHMHNTANGLHKRESKAFSLGTIIHAAILEPHKMLSSMVVGPDCHHSSKEWKAFKAEQDAAGKLIVEESDLEIVKRTVDRVSKNSTAKRLIDASKHEVSIFWADKLMGSCKARLDGLHDSCILEVKTTSRITPRAFGMQFFDLGYDLQAGWYQHAAEVATGKKMPVMFLVVDVSADADCYLTSAPDHIIERGYQQAREIALAYRAAQATGVFYGVSKGEDQLPLEVPRWIEGGETTGTVPEETANVEEL